MKPKNRDAQAATETHRMTPRLTRMWVGPAVAAGLCLVTVGGLLWYAHQHDLQEHAREFASDTDSAVRSVALHLRANEEYLTLLAADLAQGDLASPSFHEKAAQFARDNSELENVVWGGPDLQILELALPDGLPVNRDGRLVSTRSAEAASRARETRRPAYTGLIPNEQGGPTFEVYVPAFRDHTFLGFIGGVYSCDKVLGQTLPAQVLDNNRISLTNPDDAVACSYSHAAEIDPHFTREVELASIGQGFRLRLESYKADLFATEVWLLVALCVGLTLWMGYGLFALARFAAERQRAQEVLRRERDNLVNVFEAMEDGITIVSPQLGLQYVNPVLVKDFGPYAGRKCYEYFHGHAAPCPWCMMPDVIAGKAVHTEWCYPRNGRTYDLIDTRVNNPDGSVAKLKIFRDITERLEAETALKESEERFHRLFERASDAIFLHDLGGRIVEVNQEACDSLGYQREQFRDLTIRDVLVGPEQDPPGEATAPPASFIAEHRRKDGSTFPVEIRVSTLDHKGQALVLASARDVTERRRAERAIELRLEAEKAAAEEARLRLAESESLQRVSTALLQGITLEDVLEVVCREAQHLTRATGSGVLMLEDGLLRLTKSTGHPAPGTDSLLIEGSFGGLAVKRNDPVLVNDLSTYDLCCYREPRPGALIAVPLRVEGSTIGVLDVAGGAGSFQREDIRLLSHFADQAAIAIENARLREQAGQLALMAERHRLARELHDSVTQALYSAALYAEAASLAIASGKTDLASTHMEVLRSLAREAMLEMRLLIFELHPPALEQEGLVGAIETRLATVEARAGLQTDISVAGDQDGLSPDAEEALYRFTQEALNNVIKHARAKTVRVRAEFEPTAVRLEVADNGVGFDTANMDKKAGVGLRGMRERLERLGGRMEIESGLGLGARVRAEIPL